MREVFTNIIMNGVSSMQDGGSVVIVGEAIDGEVCVSFEDTGVGIADEHLEHIFEPFFSTKGEDGNGIGLSVALGIVEKHGGRIEVSSELGSGTRMSVFLPVTEESEVADSEGEDELIG